MPAILLNPIPGPKIDVLDNTTTYRSLQDWVDTTQSAGRISGGAATDNLDGTLDVALGKGFIKSADSDIGATLFFDWPDVPALAPGDLRKSWVYVSYNVGVPTVLVTDTYSDIDLNTEFPIIELWRDGNDLHIMEKGQNVYNLSMRTHRNLEQMFGFRRGSGLITSESGAARTVDVTAGLLYRGLNEIPIAHIDTDPGGLADTFDAYYRDGAAGWTIQAGQDDISNTNYDDGDGVLGTISVTRYGVFWVYICFQGLLYVQYGQGNYKLAEAEAAPVPEPPPFLAEFGTLIARVLVLRNAATFYSVSFPWDEHFNFSAVSEHNNLGGLDEGDFHHLTAAEYAGLAGGIVPDHEHTDAAGDGGSTLRPDLLITPQGALLTLDAAGAITVTHSLHRVDTFGGAATDDLTDISAGATGQILILRSNNTARDVVVKETGNIRLDAAGDFTLSAVADRIMLQYWAAWMEISRSNNA